MSSATTVPSSRPKVVAEKARSEKPLSISSRAISSPPKPKPMTMPNSAPWFDADVFRPHLADGVTRRACRGPETKGGWPKVGSWLVGRCARGRRVGGRRLVVPEEAPQAEPVQVARWRRPGCRRWLARWWPVVRFAARFPPDLCRTANRPSIFSKLRSKIQCFLPRRRFPGCWSPSRPGRHRPGGSGPARRKPRC